MAAAQVRADPGVLVPHAGPELQERLGSREAGKQLLFNTPETEPSKTQPSLQGNALIFSHRITYSPPPARGNFSGMLWHPGTSCFFLIAAFVSQATRPHIVLLPGSRWEK